MQGRATLLRLDANPAKHNPVAAIAVAGSGSAYPLGNLCAPCEPFWYASVETLFMQRQGGNYSASPDFGMDDFDFEMIPRLTIGCVPDCINGCELTFTGVAEWKQSGSASNPAGGIGTFLTTVCTVRCN